MAGIGFRLQKLLSGESYTDLIKAYAYSSLISAGPFIVVIVTMGFIRMAVSSTLSLDESSLFMGFIIYEYAFSMLGISPFMYVVTRYLADKYYLKQVETFSPTYLAVLELVFLIQTLLAGSYLYFLNIEISTKLILLLLYLVLSGIWIAMIFLSAARNYLWIVSAFFAGGALSIMVALVLGYRTGLNGFLLGFTFGQGVCFFVLTTRIFLEFGYKSTHDYGYLSYLYKYSDLFFVGLFYYLGIWVDKIFFWNSSVGEEIIPGLRVFQDYDTPLFLAYVSVIPSMAFFLVQMETTFVHYYHAYYQSIRRRESLEEIQKKRIEMMKNITQQFQKFVVFQGVITGMIILFIYRIADAFFLNPAQMGILRIGLLAAFLQMGFIMIINILFYFDMRKDTAWLTVLFCFSNLILTYWTFQVGLPAYGFGYAGACGLSVLIGIFVLDGRMKALDYLTFMKQPILIPKFKLEKDR